MVISREGTLYVLNDSIWQSPVYNTTKNDTQQQPDCIIYNNTGIITYNGSKTLCTNSSIHINDSQVMTWDHLKISELGNIDVINLLVNSSQVSIGGNLDLIGHLSLQGDSYFQVYGNFTMLESSILVIEDTASLFINGCLSLNGEVTFYQNFSVITNGYIKTISNYTCYNGLFNNFQIKPIDEPDECITYTSELVYSVNSVFVKYNVHDNCGTNTDLETIKLTTMIIIPILFTLVIITGILYHVYRKIEIKTIYDNLKHPSSSSIP